VWQVVQRFGGGAPAVVETWVAGKGEGQACGSGKWWGGVAGNDRERGWEHAEDGDYRSK
jgi:hypothetical protein